MSDRYDELRAAHNAMEEAWSAHYELQLAYRDTVSRLVKPGDTVCAFIDDAKPDECCVIDGVVVSVWSYHLYVAEPRPSCRVREVCCEDVFVVNDANFLYDPDDGDDEPGNEPF